MVSTACGSVLLISSARSILFPQPQQHTLFLEHEIEIVLVTFTVDARAFTKSSYMSCPMLRSRLVLCRSSFNNPADSS